MLALTAALVGSCDNRESDGSGAPLTKQNQPPKEAISESKVELPEYYGLYAVDSGKTVELKNDGSQSFSSNVEFILFSKAVASDSKDLALRHLVFVQGVSATQPDHGPNRLPFRSGGWSERSIAFRTKPVKENPEIIRIVPEHTLPSGMFRIGTNDHFWVNRDAHRSDLVQKATDAKQREDWLEVGRVTVTFFWSFPDDPEYGDAMKDVRLQALIALTERAIAKQQWEDAEQNISAERYCNRSDDKRQLSELMTKVKESRIEPGGPPAPGELPPPIPPVPGEGP